ncbi:glycosyltransferase [Bizionia sp. KMM 8389]
MKKVVFFVESMHCGGAERSLLSLLQNLDRNKYDIDLLVINKGGEFEQFIPENINYKSLNLSYSLMGKLKFFLNKKIETKAHAAQLFWKSFRKEIPAYSETYDVAIAWGQGFATYFTGTKIKAKNKYAWINIDYDKAGYQFKYDKAIYSEFNKVIGVSDFVRDSMSKYIATDKLMSIVNIIDENDVIERADYPEAIGFDLSITNIVSVGRLAEQKAFGLAIETAKHLKDKGVVFKWYIIGEGPDRKNLEKSIEAHKLEDTFILLGHKDNPYPYIKACDVYVQTSSFEGLGRTIIEASLLNKPIVTTNFPTAYGLLDNEQTGLIVDMDAVTLSNSIERLIADEHFKLTLIENLKKKKNLNKQSTLDHVYALLD